MTILARRIAGATAYLGAPANWTPDADGDCGHLAIREHGDARSGKGWVESAWEVTPDDVERLREGRSLIVRIHGWQPPIALYIDPQKPDLLPSDIARKAWSDAEETAFQAGSEEWRQRYSLQAAEYKLARERLLALADETLILRSALEAAKLDIEERADPCGEPYNTICAALEEPARKPIGGSRG